MISTETSIDELANWSEEELKNFSIQFKDFINLARARLGIVVDEPQNEYELLTFGDLGRIHDSHLETFNQELPLLAQTCRAILSQPGIGLCETFGPVRFAPDLGPMVHIKDGPTLLALDPVDVALLAHGAHKNSGKARP